MAICNICKWTWRKRRTLLRCSCLLIALIIAIIIIVIHNAVDESRCDDKELKKMLSEICKAYKESKVTGSLCRPLCVTAEVHYTKCLNYKTGKKIIFANWEDKSVILKAKNRKPKEREILGYSYTREEIHIPNIDYFMQMLRQTISEEFGIHDTKSDEDLLYLLWTGTEAVDDILLRGDLTAQEQTKQRSVMVSLWSLVQQTEYIFLQYFNDNQHLPMVFGSCGHVYAMEYAPSTGVLDPDILQVTGVSHFSWHERVKVAIDLLNVLKSAEQDFHEPLRFCDVKGSNFGISQDGKVKPIDTDTVFFKSKLEEILPGQETCENNKDCEFFDCLGRCNMDTHKCYNKIANNNLEAVCRKILTGSLENMYIGLLSDPPSEIKTRLDDILEECLQLKDERLVHSETIFDNLYTLLQKSNKFN